jgi:hypothetical protein
MLGSGQAQIDDAAAILEFRPLWILAQKAEQRCLVDA